MAEARLINDCFLHDKDRITHGECVSLILNRLNCVAGTEPIPLERALGRFCSGRFTAPRNVPLHDNSAVDGYAFAHGDYLVSEGSLRVAGRVAAGDTDNADLAAGAAVRIFTGAQMPKGADTVAMQEDCKISGDGKYVSIPAGLKQGANRRLAGEDLAEGDDVISQGCQLAPQDIAALASLGKDTVPVFSKLRIAVVSTGNELVEPGGTIAPGLVFDSNRAMLKALLSTLPVTVTDLGILRDERDLVEKTISTAARDHDLIVTTGGASRGEEDHVVNAIDRLGKRHLWQIAIKPGRPMAFGQIGDCVFVGLPGNPVAAFVCFLLYARPALTLMGGGVWQEPVRIPLPAAFEMPKKKADRREFQRGWLEPDGDGLPHVHKFPRDGSGLISGLRQATGLIELPENVVSVSPGDTVAFIPFSAFGIMS